MQQMSIVASAAQSAARTRGPDAGANDKRDGRKRNIAADVQATYGSGGAQLARSNIARLGANPEFKAQSLSRQMNQQNIGRHFVDFLAFTGNDQMTEIEKRNGGRSVPGGRQRASTMAVMIEFLTVYASRAKSRLGKANAKRMTHSSLRGASANLLGFVSVFIKPVSSVLRRNVLTFEAWYCWQRLRFIAAPARPTAPTT